MYHYDSVYIDTRYWKCSNIVCKGRAKSGNLEGKDPVEFVSIIGTHLKPPNPMKHKLCETVSTMRLVRTMCANWVDINAVK